MEGIVKQIENLAPHRSLDDAFGQRHSVADPAVLDCLDIGIVEKWALGTLGGEDLSCIREAHSWVEE